MEDQMDQTLRAAGHITTEESNFSEPVTVGGYYEASNGFWYLATWNAGRLRVAETGYSAAYLAADREFGPMLCAEDAQGWDEHMRKALGLEAE